MQDKKSSARECRATNNKKVLYENNTLKQEKIKQYIDNIRQKTIKSIENANDVELLLGLPIAIATDQNASFNFVVADAGKGKTLFTQKTLEHLYFKTENNFLTIIFDFESDPSVLKQRHFEKLLKSENVILFFNENIEDIHELYEKKHAKHTGATLVDAIAYFLKEMRNAYNDKKLIVVIDSFEDLVTNVEKTDVIKKELKQLFIPDITYIFNHHINKNELQIESMRFAGSRVLKAKALSMLYLINREITDDDSLVFGFKVLKTRFFYENKELTVKFTQGGNLEVVNMIAAGETKVVLSVAYSVLKEKGTLKQNKLLEEIRERLNRRIGVNKIRNVIVNSEKFFEIRIGDKNAKIYSITNNPKIIENLYMILGWKDMNETKRELLNLIQIARIVGLDDKIKVDGVIYANLSVLQKDVLSMSEARAEACVERLSIMLEDAESE